MTETDRAYHEWAATLPDEEGLAAIDFLYHDFLPPDTNCRLCGIEHAAINPDSDHVERTEPRPCYWCGEPFPCPTYRSIGAHARQDFPWRR